jgi:hypothetical protein
MPNNQDNVKLPLGGGWYIEYPKGFIKGDPREGEYWLFDNRDIGKMLIGFCEHEALQFAAAMNAPTPREQELEAQNKALWELVGHVEERLKYAVGRSYIDCVATTREAIETIQKAKEAR